MLSLYCPHNSYYEQHRKIASSICHFSCLHCVAVIESLSLDLALASQKLEGQAKIVHSALRVVYSRMSHVLKCWCQDMRHILCIYVEKESEEIKTPGVLRQYASTQN